MKSSALIYLINKLGEYKRLRECLEKGQGPASVFGLGEAHRANIAATLAYDTGKSVVYVTATETAAEKMLEDIAPYIETARHFPVKEIQLIGKSVAASGSLEARRANILLQLAKDEKHFTVISAETLMQRLAPKDALIGAEIRLKTGDSISPQQLLKKLISCGYVREEQCEYKGQVTLRGGRVDVFPHSESNPCRLEFFGDEIDTMRLYDPVSQRATENINEIVLPPATETPVTDEAREYAVRRLKGKKGYEEEYDALQGGLAPQGLSRLICALYKNPSYFTDYLSEDTIILMDEPVRIEESAKTAHILYSEGVASALESGGSNIGQEGLMCSPAELVSMLDTPLTAMVFSLTRSYNPIRPKSLYSFVTKPAPVYLSMQQTLLEDIVSYRRLGYTILFFAGASSARVKDLLDDYHIFAPVVEELNRDVLQGEIIIVSESLNKGFEYPEIKLAVITENELYGTVKRSVITPKKTRQRLVFSDLSTGDYVVHDAHGIGLFTGVETLTVDEKTRDYLVIKYLEGDKLFIPTDQLDRVQKYIGSGEEAPPKISRLGGTEWQRAVSRTRESVKSLAFDLVRLYSARGKRKGHKFSKDTPWQKQLESSFQYAETPDQLTSLQEIKADMESDKVMDRLLCGDVGYGKTEVAIRAAFKAVLDGKQVAMLVPTTILAQQHYNTLMSRLAGYPVEIGLLSRFKTKKEQRDIVKRIGEGAVDIAVGTHMLLSDGVKFRDLGLLIVDEEQRFGVEHKEKIKNIKNSVDVLTLSATPIPRTLHMSMVGIRDFSTIETPPEQRYPVQTYVMEYDERFIREAVLKEIGRGGQVYFVYNNVRGMERFCGRLRELVPEARIAFAHGQMSERVLEKTMLSFLEGEYDVLLCSTIIESGLDIQNVNTIIVYDADKMGLAQLYQLRGRVGRGTRLGYAYLTFKRDKVLSETAEKRLQAIRQFTQFGAGFKIAMRDLEIRGAGNILGAEQHGHMAEIGYNLYCRLMDEAVREAKGEPSEQIVETSLEIPLDAHIPKNYIASEGGRLNMYKRIAAIASKDDVIDVQDELIDRYGDIPAAVQNLIDVAYLKAMAQKTFIIRIQVTDGMIKIVFSKNARLLPEKLIAFAKENEGAQLISAEEPVLIIRRKRADADALFKILPQYVYSITDCAELKNSV